MIKNFTLPYIAFLASLLAILPMAGCVNELEGECPSPQSIALQVEENGSISTKGGSSTQVGAFEIELPEGLGSIPVSISKAEATKGAPINNADNPLKDVWLWAKLTDDGSDYISGHELEKRETIWDSGHYWPAKRILSFLACSTSGEELGFSPDVQLGSGGKLACKFDYKVEKGTGSLEGRDAEAQADILLGMTFNRDAAGKDVPMRLHHALAAVKFVVGNVPYGLKLKSIGFTNLYSKATCAVSGELYTLNFAWSGHSEILSYKQSYDQKMTTGDDIGGKEQTFVLIPQEFNSEDAMLEIGFEIQDRSYVLKKSLMSIIADSKLEADHIYTFRLGIPDEIDIEVEDKVAGNVKSNVVIKNTGFGPGYVRMALVGNWVNKHGIIIAPWLPEDGEFEDWNPDWMLRSDGFYYYKYLVLGGATVPAPFSKYTLTTLDHSGQTLYLSVMTQIIHPEFMNIWPSRPTDDWKWPLP